MKRMLTQSEESKEEESDDEESDHEYNEKKPYKDEQRTNANIQLAMITGHATFAVSAIALQQQQKSRCQSMEPLCTH